MKKWEKNNSLTELQYNNMYINVIRFLENIESYLSNEKKKH